MWVPHISILRCGNARRQPLELLLLPLYFSIPEGNLLLSLPFLSSPQSIRFCTCHCSSCLSFRRNLHLPHTRNTSPQHPNPEGRPERSRMDFNQATRAPQKLKGRELKHAPLHFIEPTISRPIAFLSEESQYLRTSQTSLVSGRKARFKVEIHEWR